MRFLSAGQEMVAGYSGNLRMEALDRITMMPVIGGNPGIKFIFWGSYKTQDLNLGGVEDKDTDAFISFLEVQPNVELRGVVRSEQLQIQNEGG